MAKKKRPRDVNQRAKQIVDEATGQAARDDQQPSKDPSAVVLGRKGGLKGGKARAANLSKAELSAIGKKAAKARWGVRKASD